MQRPKNPLLPILIFVTAYASPALVTAVDNPPTSKTGATDTARAPSASKPPMVTKNPDGTITLRKILLRIMPKDGTNKKGLVIPPQVIAPTFKTPENKQ
jgi:hypothetical protein